MFGFGKNKIIVNYHALNNKMVEYDFIHCNLHFYYYYLLNFYMFCKNREYNGNDLIGFDLMYITFHYIKNNRKYVKIHKAWRNHVNIGTINNNIINCIFIDIVLRDFILKKLSIYYPDHEDDYINKPTNFNVDFSQNKSIPTILLQIFKKLKIYKFKD